MNIKQITIEGHAGDVEIRRTDTGAIVRVERLTRHSTHRVVAEIGRDDTAHARYFKALEVAKAVYGMAKRGEANCTNSMVHDLMNEIDRVAGC